MVNGEWLNHWLNAGTLVGGAMFSDRDLDSLYPVNSALDTDQDGLPDAWEIANGLNPFTRDTNGNGVGDGEEDNDLDGLDNLYEYLSGLNPNNPETIAGRPDGAVDTDGDGLSNRQEQDNHSDPSRVDTDDDGISDFNEVRGTSPQYPGWYTLPNASLSPAKAGVLQISGVGQYLEMPTNQPRLSLQGSWTIEAWVNMDPAFGGTGTVIGRSVGSMVNYQLGIAAGLPYVRFAGVYNGNLYPVQATGTAVLNRRSQWYHLAGVYDKDAGELRLLVDGSVVATADASVHPSLVDSSSVVVARVGEGFRGQIDEVRIWNVAESGTNISVTAYKPCEGMENGPVLYYRFDDGPFGLSTYSTSVVLTNYTGGISTQQLLGATVEDFAMPLEDWKNNLLNAGRLVNATMAEAVNTPILATDFRDEDSDLLP
ncbi:MAG: LamG-like jellyroll fold domain-containing protein, partial [bacterium]